MQPKTPSPLLSRPGEVRWRRQVVDSLLALAGVALVTNVIAVAHLYSGISGISMVYLLVVVGLASTRGLYAAILTSLLAVIAYDFFFVFPPMPLPWSNSRTY